MIHNIFVRKKDLFLGESEAFNFQNYFYNQGNNQPSEEMANHTTLPVQQAPASTYNHPCGDLLEGGRRREYLDIAVPLYKASIQGDLEAAKVLLQDHEYLVRYSITKKQETPLHVAAAGQSTKFVSYLVNKMSKVDLELQNGDGNTAFCIAAISGNVGMVKIMFEKNQALPTICGSENMMPLYLAAFHGKHDMVTFLYDQSDRMMDNCWTNDSRNVVLLKCIQAGLFDVALRILDDNEQLPQEHLWDMLQVLAENSWAFYENRPRKGLLQLIRTVIRSGIKESNATAFLRLLWKRILEKPTDFIDDILRGPAIIDKDNMETYPSEILFIAAKMNNTQFIVELISEYPDLLLWKRNDNGQTIFHIAVSHRQPDIYGLLYEIGSMKDQITPIIDKEGNNILHLVGKNVAAHEDGVSTPFEMVNEFLWYKEVEGILPPPCRVAKNVEGKTPHELFTENRRKLVSKGMKTINNTINISMVVATLVCTIGFSVATSVPGGFDQNTGFPILHYKEYFIGFVLMDVLSFISATSSIIFFLSVILSRHHRNMEGVVRTWWSAQMLLLSSVLFVVTAFIFSLFLQYLESRWMSMINVLSYLLLVLFAYIGASLANSSVRTVFGKRFRPKKHRLYRVIIS